jgi:glucose-1-phosphate thymidylyltransferase
MKAVILAAGKGTRLDPFTVSQPKVMIDVANKPILEYVVDSLVKNAIRDIVMVVGYKKEKIMSHFEDGGDFDAHIEYVTQDKQLGTAHALYYAKDLMDEEFIMLPGDNIIDPTTIADLLEKRKGISIVITESEHPSKYGVVELSKGVIKKYVEKPVEEAGNLISTAICSFQPSIFDTLRPLMDEGKYDITDLIQTLVATENVQGIFTSGMWADAVFPWDLLKVNSLALNRITGEKAGTVERGASLNGPVSVGEGSVIKSGSYIDGPVVIGKGCEIGPNVTLNPSTSIGDNVRIAPFSLVEHSVIMSDASLGPHSYLSNSVVGPGCQFSSRFSASSGPTIFILEGEQHELPSIGTFIGEDTVIDSGVVAEPGSIIGASSRIQSQAVLSGKLPNKSIVI